MIEYWIRLETKDLIREALACGHALPAAGSIVRLDDKFYCVSHVVHLHERSQNPERGMESKCPWVVLNQQEMVNPFRQSSQPASFSFDTGIEL